MAEKSLRIRIQHKIDTEENWKKSTLVLYPGEIAFSSDRDFAYKIGNGKNTWKDLSYAAPFIKELSTEINNIDIDTDLAANSGQELGVSYIVDTNQLEVSVSGALLYKGLQYEEVGDAGEESTSIKFLVPISAGSQLHVVLRKFIAYGNNITTTKTDFVLMTGATETTNGTSGIVTAPLAGQQNNFLSGAGTWLNPLAVSDFDAVQIFENELK